MVQDGEHSKVLSVVGTKTAPRMSPIAILRPANMSPCKAKGTSQMKFQTLRWDMTLAYLGRAVSPQGSESGDLRRCILMALDGGWGHKPRSTGGF